MLHRSYGTTSRSLPLCLSPPRPVPGRLSATTVHNAVLRGGPLAVAHLLQAELVRHLEARGSGPRNACGHLFWDCMRKSWRRRAGCNSVYALRYISDIKYIPANPKWMGVSSDAKSPMMEHCLSTGAGVLSRHYLRRPMQITATI